MGVIIKDEFPMVPEPREYSNLLETFKELHARLSEVTLVKMKQYTLLRSSVFG